MFKNTAAAPIIDFDTALTRLASSPMDPRGLSSLISELGSNNPAYFHNKYKGGLHLQQVPDELSRLSAYLLQRFAGRQVKYLEVGVGSCGTMIFLGHLFRRHGIGFIPFAVDNFSYTSKSILSDQRARVQWCEENLNLKFFECDSSQGNPAGWLNDHRLNLILIDADHTFEGCFLDFLTYLPCLERDGVMLFHDINACADAVGDVYKFARDFFAESKEFSELNSCGIGLLDALIGEPPSAASVGRVMHQRLRAQARRFSARRPMWQRVRQKVMRLLHPAR